MNYAHYMNVVLGPEYRALKKGEHDDDRRLFVNMYESLHEAAREFESLKVGSVIIRIGFKNEFDLRFKELEDLFTSLRQREMV